MFGLVPQVPSGPCAWNDDDRRYSAQFARDRLREQGSARGAAAVGIRPPHDRVVGVAASGDVNMVDLWMLREVPADRCAARDDAQQPAADERGECTAVHLEQRVEGGVEFEDRHPVVGDELVDHVERGDRGDVARTEHEPHTTGQARGQLAETSGSGCLRRRRARGEPHIRAKPVKQQLLVWPVWQYRDGDAPARRRPEPGVIEGASTARERAQRLAKHPHGVEGGVGAADPLFADVGRGSVEQLHGCGGRDPVRRLPLDRLEQLAHQPCALAERGARPELRTLAQFGDCGVEGGVLLLVIICGRGCAVVGRAFGGVVDGRFESGHGVSFDGGRMCSAYVGAPPSA